MRTVLIPPKYVEPFTRLAQRLEQFQDAAAKARASNDAGLLELCRIGTQEALKGMTMIQNAVWGGEIRTLMKVTGASVHTSYQMDPPAIVFYDSDEEFERTIAQEEARARAAGETFIHVQHHQGMPPEEE